MNIRTYKQSSTISSGTVGFLVVVNFLYFCCETCSTGMHEVHLNLSSIVLQRTLNVYSFISPAGRRSCSRLAHRVHRREGRGDGPDVPLSVRPLAGQKRGRWADHEGAALCQQRQAGLQREDQ